MHPMRVRALRSSTSQYQNTKYNQNNTKLFLKTPIRYTIHYLSMLYSSLIGGDIDIHIRTELSNFIQNNVPSVDPNIVKYYQYGLVIGLVIVTTLAIFPGEPLGIPYGKDVTPLQTERAANNNNNNHNNNNNNTPTKSYQQEDKSGGVDGTSDNDDNDHDKIEQDSAADTNSVQMEQLLGKQFGLSPQQVKNIMEKSRHHDNNNNNNNNNYQDAHTFHRILNRLVYIISFSALIYVLNRDYNNFASFWFAYYFPKEATTLGMFVPQSKGR